MKVVVIKVCLLIAMSITGVRGQSLDTARIEESILIPRKAGLLSAVLPGLGQVYNGKSWKIPIIYGTAAILGYAFVNYNDQYQIYARARQAIVQNIPEANPLSNIDGGTNLNTITSAVDGSRRQRDFMVILIAALYGLQIADAIVDAHLSGFDISDSLSLTMPCIGSSIAFSQITISINHHF